MRSSHILRSLTALSNTNNDASVGVASFSRTSEGLCARLALMGMWYCLYLSLWSSVTVFT